MDKKTDSRLKMTRAMQKRIKNIHKELGGWEAMRGSCHPRFIVMGGWRDGPDYELFTDIPAEHIPDAAMKYTGSGVALETILDLIRISEDTLRDWIAKGLFPASLSSKNPKWRECWNQNEVLAWFDTMLVVASWKGPDLGHEAVENLSPIKIPG